MLATIISTILLTNSIDVIRQHHLDNPEGRVQFLTESLTPYVTAADALNQEIMALSQEVTEKMALMTEMLPTLQMAIHINDDLAELDDILNSEEMTPEQQIIADRVASLCEKLN